MRMQIVVKDDLTPKLKVIQTRIMPNLQTAVGQSIKLVEKKALANARGRFRAVTGRLFASIVASRPKTKGNKVFAQLPSYQQKGSHWFIGKIHEKGAVIRAKKKKFLRVLLPDGSIRFVKQVVLPKRPWFGPAWQASLNPIKGIFNKCIEAIFR